MMRFSLRLYAASLLAVGCMPPQLSRNTPSASQVLDANTEIFSAVVQALSIEANAPLRVDPRPLRADPTIVSATPFTPVGGKTQQLAFAEISESMLRARHGVLRRLGITQTDAVANEQCPGAMIPVEFVRDRSSCPQSGYFTSAVLALARDQKWGVAGADSPRVGRGVAEGLAVRVILRSMSPAGASSAISDYVVSRDNATRQWSVLKVVPVMWID